MLGTSSRVGIFNAGTTECLLYSLNVVYITEERTQICNELYFSHKAVIYVVGNFMAGQHFGVL
jgi:hypothetical protein